MYCAGYLTLFLTCRGLRSGRHRQGKFEAGAGIFTVRMDINRAADGPAQGRADLGVEYQVGMAVQVQSLSNQKVELSVAVSEGQK